MKKTAFLIYGVLSYFLFFGTVLYMMGFMVDFLVPKSMNIGGAETPMIMLDMHTPLFSVEITITYSDLLRQHYRQSAGQAAGHSVC